MNMRKRPGFPLSSLSRMQRYIAEELVEKYHGGLINGSLLLRSLIVVTGSAAAAAALLASTQEPSPSDWLSQLKLVPPNGPLVVPENDPTVHGQMVSFGGEQAISGYLVKPAKAGNYPGVIVIHEANGLSDHIKDVTRRLAKAGFVALAPDLLSRWGITPELPLEKLWGYLANAQPQEIVADLNATVDYLASLENVTGKVGVVGFCFGGGYSLTLVGANPRIAAAVCYYGVTPQPPEQMAGTNAAILGQYGAADPRVNSTVPELEKVLAENGKPFEKYFYEGAGHAFNNDTIFPAYKEEVAVLAWQRTLDWFHRYLD